MGASSRAEDWMGATSVLRKGEVVTSRTRGEGSLVDCGDGTAGCTHVSHKSKSQICERVRMKPGPIPAQRIPCIDVRCCLAPGHPCNCHSAFQAERRCVASADVHYHRPVHDIQNLQESAQIHHKTIYEKDVTQNKLTIVANDGLPK